MQASLDISKNFIAVLAFNYAVDVEHNFELDVVQMKSLVQMAIKINEKACKGRSPSYNKLTVRLNTLMLEFYQVLTKEQFNTLKSKAITGNLKSKFTPEIMRHSAIFWFRRNDLKEAGRLIQRAIEINSKVLNDAGDHKHESYIKLFVW